MTERYPHKNPINDAIRRIENPLHDEMMAIYNLGLEDGKSDVLDKIRAEIEQIEINGHISDVECFNAGINVVLNIINKYKAESEDEE